MISPDDDGPYNALISPVDGGLKALFERDTVRGMAREMDQATGAYGGLAWLDPDILLVDHHAMQIGDHDPWIRTPEGVHRVRPDERGLYDLGVDASFWREHPHDAPAVVSRPHGSSYERATCDTCARPIQRRPGRQRWWHFTVLTLTATLPCRGHENSVATAARPSSALRLVLQALVTARASEVVVFDHGFGVYTRPTLVELVFMPGQTTPAQVAALLGLPISAVTDQRTRRDRIDPADAPSYLRHNLTTIGGGRAWRYAATEPDDDLSDHFWLEALGVNVMIRRRPGGTYVAVEDEGIPADALPLTVEVNNTGDVEYY
ncbi:hypothetical protein [Polymorphospora sp. NPDC050346]|uniref:hypothetical protein n=1 Tax=Polymorphospora sp. NPDC050346 TaxID=3155780 RepID=UPI0033DC7A2B